MQCTRISQKGFAPLLLLLIVAGVLIIGGVSYYEMRKSSSPLTTVSPLHIPINSPTMATRTKIRPTSTPPMPTSTAPLALDTTGWQTYRNEQYGIEFKYPNTFKVTENKWPSSMITEIDIQSPEGEVSGSLTDYLRMSMSCFPEWGPSPAGPDSYGITISTSTRLVNDIPARFYIITAFYLIISARYYIRTTL